MTGLARLLDGTVSPYRGENPSITKLDFIHYGAAHNWQGPFLKLSDQGKDEVCCPCHAPL